MADGRGIVAALALGAQGVWMGTRFVATARRRTATTTSKQRGGGLRGGRHRGDARGQRQAVPPHPQRLHARVPALNYAERDRLEGRLSQAEESTVSDSTRELIADAADWISAVAPELPGSKTAAAAPELPGQRLPLRVLGYAANGTSDALALGMLAHLVEDLPIEMEIHPTRLHTNALVSFLRDQNMSVLCIGDLPPSPPSRTRYVVKRLRVALPDLRIVVGRWAPTALADESSDELMADGATFVAATLLDTRDYLASLLDMPRVAAADSGVHDAQVRAATPVVVASAHATARRQ